MLRVGSRAAEKQVGLSGAQLFVLRALSEQPAQSLNELALRTRTHQSSVSVVVQRLVDRRLVARDRSEGDLRRLELSLTSAGHTLLRKAPDAVQTHLIDALDRLSFADQCKLSELLAQLVPESGDSAGPPQMFFEESPSRGGKRTRKNRRKKKAPPNERTRN